MTVTTTVRDVNDDGTAAGDEVEVGVAFDGLPAGIAPADNELGTRMALDKLASLVER